MGVALSYFGMASIPITDVTAFTYLAAIYVAVIAAPYIDEKVAARQDVGLVDALNCDHVIG